MRAVEDLSVAVVAGVVVVAEVAGDEELLIVDSCAAPIADFEPASAAAVAPTGIQAVALTADIAAAEHANTTGEYYYY